MKRLLLMLVVCSCATLGNEAPFPDPIQTSGVGPFRALDELETGNAGLPDGRAVILSGGVGGGMFAGGQLFYTEAAPLDVPPERDGALEPTAVDWNQFEPRRIFRSVARPGDMGHDEGVEVLAPTETFEAGGVFDPWTVMLPDGRARLYYATSEGIAIAEAANAAGSFARTAGPFFAGATSPTVVEDPAGGWLMYTGTSDGISVARSTDGVAFETVSTVDVSTPPIEDEPAEVAFGEPGALVATMPTGRTVVRLYFRVSRADGTRFVAIAASEDGLTFERRPAPVFSDESSAPSPRLLEDGTTLLYLTTARELPASDIQARVLLVTVAPAFVRFADVPEEG